MKMFVLCAAVTMNDSECNLAWMKDKEEEIKERVKSLFDRECDGADMNTKALFRACFVKILPKTCHWWCAVVDCGTTPTVKDAVENAPPCTEAFLCLTIETHARRMSLAKKPDASNKRKMTNAEPPINETLRGKNDMVFGGRPKGEPQLGGTTMLNKCTEILAVVNERRRMVKDQLKRLQEASSMRSAQANTSGVDDSGEDEKGKMCVTWHESLAEEIVKLRATEQSKTQRSQAVETSEASMNNAHLPNKTVVENTAFMNEWLGAKCATGI